MFSCVLHLYKRPIINATARGMHTATGKCFLFDYTLFVRSQSKHSLSEQGNVGIILFERDFKGDACLKDIS